MYNLYYNYSQVSSLLATQTFQMPVVLLTLPLLLYKFLNIDPNKMNGINYGYQGEHVHCCFAGASLENLVHAPEITH